MAVGTAFAFTDVTPQYPYSTAISDLTDRMIVTGYADGSFRPENSMLRAQFAKMIVGALKVDPSTTVTSPFVDLGPPLSADGYPGRYVTAAYISGIVEGKTPDHFFPYFELSRAQAITMIVRAAAHMDGVVLVPPPDEYRSTLGGFSRVHGRSAAVAEYNGLLEGLVGFGADWDPWVPATRGEVAQMIHNLLALADEPDPPSTTTTTSPPRSSIGRIVFDGDSLTAGSGATDPYPSQFARMWPGPLSWINFGIGGQRMQDMLANAPRQVDPLYNPRIGRCVVVAWGGTNDLALWKHSPQVVYTSVRDYCLGRLRAGFEVVVLTTLPRSDIKSYPGFEPNRQDLNYLIRCNWREFADALADVAADPKLGESGAELNQEYFNPDRVHLNNDGLGLVARHVFDTVSGM
jgi:lysophospholipase L1-like esterase